MDNVLFPRCRYLESFVWLLGRFFGSSGFSFRTSRNLFFGLNDFLLFLFPGRFLLADLLFGGLFSFLVRLGGSRRKDSGRNIFLFLLVGCCGLLALLLGLAGGFFAI